MGSWNEVRQLGGTLRCHTPCSCATTRRSGRNQGDFPRGRETQGTRAVDPVQTVPMSAHSNRGIGRAEALRISMRELIEKGSPAEAHPSTWAPFVVVGEGGGAAEPIAPLPAVGAPAQVGRTSGKPRPKRSEPSWTAEIWKRQ
jgi:hypothetical protein